MELRGCLGHDQGMSAAPHPAITTTRVPVPSDPDDRSPLIDSATEMWRRWHLDLYGHTDLHESAHVEAVSYAEQMYTRKVWIIAQRDGSGPVVGSLGLSYPLKDNTTIAMMDLGTDPAEDQEQIGDVLWREAEAAIRAEGRSVVQCWTPHRIPGSGDEVVIAPDSGAPVPKDAHTRNYLRWGFELAQGERHSTLDLHRNRAHLANLLATAQEKSGAYETVTWVGSTPVEYLDAMAALRSRMSIDVPAAALDVEEERWDADRVRQNDLRRERAGRQQMVTVAVHQASGELAAYTELVGPTENEQVAYQEDTLAHGEHRGRRLGLLVKVRNAMALAEHLPAVRRVHTWNAEENQHMLAINVAMGFEPATVEAAWQARLT